VGKGNLVAGENDRDGDHGDRRDVEQTGEIGQEVVNLRIGTTERIGAALAQTRPGARAMRPEPACPAVRGWR
jgi:hypothetical protein